MVEELEDLLGRTNSVCRRCLELAAGLCVSETNYNIEIEHLFAKLVEIPGIDLPVLFERFEVPTTVFKYQLEQAIATFDRGNRRTPSFSPEVQLLLREAWSCTTLKLGTNRIRSAALLLAALDHQTLRPRLLQSCPVLSHISREELFANARSLIRGSAEELLVGARPAVGGTPALELVADSSQEAESASLPGRRFPDAPEAQRDESPPIRNALERYTRGLVDAARAGLIDPVRARHRELRQVVDTLMRRRQNNPILVGAAGVGKTAIVEGLALGIAEGTVTLLEEVDIRQLDLALLLAGASMKGEFETRLKALIEEVQSSERSTILFVDEAHNLIGAGGTAGRGDAANLLKPALASGTLQMIAATTWSEYKRHFESDPALARRFQMVPINEPGDEEAIEMLRGVVGPLQKHHGVRILDEAVREAVRLSVRFLPEQRLPAKAISVLDAATVRVALAQVAPPTALQDVRAESEKLERNLRILELEEEGSSTDQRAIGERLAELHQDSRKLEARWTMERELVSRIMRLERDVGEDTESHSTVADHRVVSGLQKQLDEVQSGDPLVQVSVDADVVAEVVADWTGIPARRMRADESVAVLDLGQRLASRVFGQKEALDGIARRIQTSFAGLEDPGRPRGALLLIGPSGVGKTLTGSVLAEALFATEQGLLTLNMSEFQEAHTIATLKGSPPGFVGYGEGGMLTEAVRRRPYCVLLLDDVDRAHPDVLDLFQPILDRGVLEDGEGLQVSFKNVVLLMTTSLGAEVVVDLCGRKESRPDPGELLGALQPVLRKHLPQSLLSRLEIVPFYPLGPSDLLSIVQAKLKAIQERVMQTHGAELCFEEALAEALVRSTGVTGSALELERTIDKQLLPELSVRLLQQRSKGQKISQIHIGLKELSCLV